MKNKPLKLRLSYFFGQRIRTKDSSGNMPELIKPESQWERAENELEDIFRWADDGGQMADLGPLTATANPATAREGTGE